MENDKEIQYHPVFKILNYITNTLASLVAFALFVVVITQIVGRLIGLPSPWTEEMTRYIFIWMIFLGIGIGFRKAESPRVTMLIDISPKILKNASKWIYSVGSIVFFIFMVIYGWELVQQQITMNERSSVLMIPVWVIGICFPISGVVGILYTIQSLIYHKELI